MSDIRGLEIWENETRDYNRRAGQIRMKVGSGMVEALETWYGLWKEKPTARNQREYMLWRLRVHLRHNGHPEILEELNEYFDVGLFDEKVGKTYWDIPAEEVTGFHSGFNWRRDSGNALKGGRTRKQVSSPDLEKSDNEPVQLGTTDQGDTTL